MWIYLPQWYGCITSFHLMKYFRITFVDVLILFIFCLFILLSFRLFAVFVFNILGKTSHQDIKQWISYHYLDVSNKDVCKCQLAIILKDCQLLRLSETL